MSCDDVEMLSPPRGTAYLAGRRGRRTGLSVTATLVTVPVLWLDATLRVVEAQPTSPAARRPTQASPAAKPSDVMLVAMTPNGLPAGNYPLVGAGVPGQGVLEAARRQALLTFETLASEDRLVALGDCWDGLVRAMPRP